MVSDAPLVNVLYGTVTGNAEEIARRIHLHLSSLPVAQGLLRCLSDYKDIPAFVNPASHRNAYNIIVVSTTGDGDPPETIRPFMRLIRKKEANKMKGLNFAVLALGDTNYENFCNTGKRIDAALAKMGASRFQNRGDADDGTGLENVVEPWLENLWTSLKKIAATTSIGNLENCPSENTMRNDDEGKKSEKPDADELQSLVKRITIEELGFDESRLPKIFPPKVTAETVKPLQSFQPPLSVSPSFIPDVVRRASVTDAKRLTSANCEKLVWHMEVKCDDDRKMERKYLPGDAFGVIVENDASEVKRFLPFLSDSENSIVELKKNTGTTIATASVLQFVRQRLDLRAIPKKSLLRSLSEYCSDIEERKSLLRLSSRDGRKQYSEEVSKPGMSIVQLLESKSPSCRAPISLFLDQLPAVAPRWYSATSSPELDGESTLQFAFSVVEKGLATNALSEFCYRHENGEGTGSEVLLLPRASDSMSKFRPPSTLETSYIMIGPGTGVAPFRGFLRQRRAIMEREGEQSNIGKTILFFGCRSRDTDFLYEDDLKELESSGCLSKLDVAFSREGPEKVYVQDKLKAQAQEVADIVKTGGSIFVCGDGGGMAQGVHSALGEILAEHCCDGDVEKGREMLRQLGDDNRYVRDIWYHG